MYLPTAMSRLPYLYSMGASSSAPCAWTPLVPARAFLRSTGGSCATWQPRSARRPTQSGSRETSLQSQRTSPLARGCVGPGGGAPPVQRDLHDGLGPIWRDAAQLEACLDATQSTEDPLAHDLERLYVLVGQATSDIRRLVYRSQAAGSRSTRARASPRATCERFSRARRYRGPLRCRARALHPGRGGGRDPARGPRRRF